MPKRTRRGRPAKPEKNALTKEDSLVEDIIPDPSQLPHVRTLVGFLGKSGRTAYSRLYLSATFDNFLEIRDEDIVHRRALPPERSTVGGTILWVKRDATFLHTRVVSRDAQARFLRGRITSRLLRRL